ncbi:MAG TPA: molybdenum cofactor biosynthesis protein MoaE [Bryobacteraceae bacterium]|jgi:molybdopterin synthase catalytic subunit|nr:molybdenum cofactor biosynthesis protein MoaE [Bryobacteraceae bacterium]
MRVNVLFFGILKDLTGRAEEALDVPPGTTIGAVFRRYAERFETLDSRRPSILFARNQEFVKAEQTLSDNDEIAFLPPVSGGSGLRIDDPAGHRFALTRDPIDAQSLSRELPRPEDGGIVVFEGIVRNNSKGRATRFLEYECYEPMALQQMARIGREIAAAFAIGRIAFIHRLGRLEIGEASVVVVATAPHRGPAFEAALTGINRLKKEVPIWKKEFFEDGAVWVDGEWDDALLANVHSSRG